MKNMLNYRKIVCVHKCIRIMHCNDALLFNCSLFPLLQSYDEHIGLSTIGYYGIIRTISLHQSKLPLSFSGSHEEIEQAIKAYPGWVRRYLTIQLV